MELTKSESNLGEINATISTIYVIAKALDVHPMEMYSFEVTGTDKK